MAFQISVAAVNDKGTTVIQSDMDRKKPKECQKITTI